MPPPSPDARSHGRRRLVTDPNVQYGVAIWLVVALVGVAGCYVIGLLLLIRLEAIQALDGKGILQVLLTMTGLYFLLAVAIVVNLSLLLTRRFMGPAQVMERALDGLLAGDGSQRLTLRRTDYLKPLASRLDVVRERWFARERDFEDALERVEACLEDGRTQDAARLVAGLRAASPDLSPSHEPREAAAASVG